MSHQFDNVEYWQQENITCAYTRERRIIHISAAESGKKGYYCIGCSKELQARKGKINVHHFAHDPIEVQKHGRCGYSDESYPHLRAKQLLLQFKKIKVPALCKYPPLGTVGETYLLREEHFVEAHHVASEVRFYEDAEGNICFKPKHLAPAPSEQYLEVQPDIVFFDETNRPILLVELVATHKLTEEKLAKIRRIGIDTVLVELPKGRPDEIDTILETIFSNSQSTKWVYCHEQEQSDYLSISKRNLPRVSFIDESQRDLIQSIESAKCAKIRIRNLIQSITRCLESGTHRDAEQRIRQEISSVETYTDQFTVQWRDLERGIRHAKQREFEQLCQAKAEPYQNIEAEIRKEQSVEYQRIARVLAQKIKTIEREQNEIDRDTKELKSNSRILAHKIETIEREQREIDGTSKTAWQHIIAIADAQHRLRQLKQAREVVETGSYKKWR